MSNVTTNVLGGVARIKGGPVDKDDLIAEGMLGVLDAEEFVRANKYRSYSSAIDKIAVHTPCKTKTVGFSPIYSLEDGFGSTLLAKDYDAPVTTSGSDNPGATIGAVANEIFLVGDMVLVQGVYGYEPDGTTRSHKNLVLAVTAVNDDEIEVKSLNGKKISTVMNCVPSILAGATLVRMGNFFNQTYSPFPFCDAFMSNYCQDFSITINYTRDAIDAINDSGKMTFNDIVRGAKNDYMIRRDKSLLYGFYNQSFGTCNGLYNLPDIKSFNYDEKMDIAQAVDMMRDLFSDSSSKYAHVLAGSRLMAMIAKLDHEFVKNGNELSNNLGTLKFIDTSDIFDSIGMDTSGVAITSNNLIKNEYKPFKEDWVENGDVLSCTFCESSCLTFNDSRGIMTIEQV